MILPKTDKLLSSMAMRFDHSFGLMEEEERKTLIETMSHVYDAFYQNIDQKNIVSQFNLDPISFKQLLEEAEGNGFYQP
jgi:uncharacterized protein YfbU (UPF0304 family)